MTVGVGSPDVSRKSRQSEVRTLAESSDSQPLSLRDDCGRRKSRPKPGVLASVVLTVWLSVLVGSPEACRESRHLKLYWLFNYARRKSQRLLGVPTLTHSRELLNLCEQYFLLTSKVLGSTSELSM